MAPMGPSAARLLNEKLIKAVREKNREEVLHLYRTEEPDLIYSAYADLWEMMDKHEMKLFEKDWEELIPEEEYIALSNEKPALKVTFMKMMALQAKKNIFG